MKLYKQLYFINLLRLFFIGVISYICFDCQNNASYGSPFSMIKDEKLKNILQRAMDKAGGWQQWKALQNVNFDKQYNLYNSSGEIEKTVLEQHHYQFLPDYHIQIKYTENGNQYEIILDEWGVQKKENGILDTTTNTTNLVNTILASTFVANLPFNILDSTAQIKYLGIDTLRSNKAVDVVQVIYNANLYEQHTHSDKWWFYFDQQDGTFWGYLVQHDNHFSYIENLSFQSIDGFQWIKERASYRTDSLRNLLYLRADYNYENYKHLFKFFTQ